MTRKLSSTDSHGKEVISGSMVFLTYLGREQDSI